RVYQRVARVQRGLPQDRQVRQRPPPRKEVPVGVRVASPLTARGEVEERAGLRSGLPEVTGSAGRSTAVSYVATARPHHPGRSRRLVKQQFPEVTLGFSGPELRVRAPIG